MNELFNNLNAVELLQQVVLCGGMLTLGWLTYKLVILCVKWAVVASLVWVLWSPTQVALDNLMDGIRNQLPTARHLISQIDGKAALAYLDSLDEDTVQAVYTIEN